MIQTDFSDDVYLESEEAMNNLLEFTKELIRAFADEGEELPADFICPLCKHGAADFEPIG